MKSNIQPSTIKVQSANIIQDDLHERRSDSFSRDEQSDENEEAKEDFERESPNTEEQAKDMSNIEEENSEEGQEEVKIIEKVIYLGGSPAKDKQSNLKKETIKREDLSKDKESMFNVININANIEVENKEDDNANPILESEEQELRYNTNIHYEAEKKSPKNSKKPKKEKPSTFQAKSTRYVIL